MANPSRKISQVRVRTPLDLVETAEKFQRSMYYDSHKDSIIYIFLCLCHIHLFDKGGHESDSFLSLCEFDSALAAFSFPYLSKCRERSNMQEEGAKWVMHVVGAPYVKSPYEM